MKALLCLACLLMTTPLAAQELEPERDPGELATKSALLPGWGQLGNDEVFKGRVYMVGAALNLVFAFDVVPVFEGNDRKLFQGIGIVSYLILAASASYDAYQTAQRLNLENGFGITHRFDPTVRVTLVRVSF